MKQSGKGRAIGSGIACIILGIVYLGLVFTDMSNLKKTVDFNQMNAADVGSADYVSGSVNMTMGYYCEETRTKYFIPVGKSRYYLVPFGKDQDKLIGLKVKKSYFEDFDKLVKKTVEYLESGVESASIGTFKGRVKSCDSEESKYLKEFWNGIDMGDTCVEYYVDVTTDSDNYFSLGFGFFILLLGVLVIVLEIKKRKRQGVETRQSTMVSEYGGIGIPVDGMDDFDNFMVNNPDVADGYYHRSETATAVASEEVSEETPKSALSISPDKESEDPSSNSNLF